MEANHLIYPMAALITLTFAVFLTLPFLRFVAVRSKKVSGKFYRLMQGATEPDLPAAFSQNYKNLLKTPVLFYAVCLLLIVLNRIDQFFIVLAWVYVGSRVIHTLVHVSYNHVLHRLTIFSASCAVLGIMWARLVINLG